MGTGKEDLVSCFLEKRLERQHHAQNGQGHTQDGANEGYAQQNACHNHHNAQDETNQPTSDLQNPDYQLHQGIKGPKQQGDFSIRFHFYSFRRFEPYLLTIV
jgi:hypothetical protein